MSTLDELMQLIASQHYRDKCTQECYQFISQHVLEQMGEGGHLSAHDAVRIYETHYWATQRAGVSTCGFEETLENLGTRAPDEIINVLGLKGPDRVFIVFVSERISELVGCIRVMNECESGRQRCRGYHTRPCSCSPTVVMVQPTQNGEADHLSARSAITRRRFLR